MNLESIHKVYFIGIGGIGMSALARYFNRRGALVCGYDRTETILTKTLVDEGVAITYKDEVTDIPLAFQTPSANTLIVYTPAIPKNSNLLTTFQNNGFELKKRSQVLGIISDSMFCIAIAGTHGKTTTSALTAHILTDTGFGCSAFLGGIAANYHSNILFCENNVMVVEADEFDRSFLTLYPNIGVITSMDADHLDIYEQKSQLDESFQLFVQQIDKKGTLYHKKDLPLSKGISYDAKNPDAHIFASNIKIENGGFVFDYNSTAHKIEAIRMPLPGIHNVENCLAAIAIALQMGIEKQAIKTAIQKFKGVKRRFEFIVKNEKCTFIDDYAHHPEELRVCFEAIRMLYPDEKLTVIFQPHLFSRTRDFANEFAEVLATVDDLILLEIYPARELPIEGIDATFLANKITSTNKVVTQKEEVLDLIRKRNPKLLLTVGAGDIDTLVQPLKNQLINNG